MGGWMTYQRMRHRNGLLRKPPGDEDPYWRPDSIGTRDGPLDADRARIAGELNRMERDYLNPVYPEPPWATREPGSDPLAEVATATGVDVETVRRVLRYVFMEQL